MRNISFALTEPQFLDGSKTVTRRLGWGRLRPGDLLIGVRKGMGLRPGEQVVRLGPIRVVSVRREPLGAITPADVRREGFPDLDPAGFVALFCRHMRGTTPATPVTRIEFARVGPDFALDLDPVVPPSERNPA